MLYHLSYGPKSSHNIGTLADCHSDRDSDSAPPAASPGRAHARHWHDPQAPMQRPQTCARASSRQDGGSRGAPNPAAAQLQARRDPPMGRSVPFQAGPQPFRGRRPKPARTRATLIHPR